jgi:hypothetical protein
MKHSRTNSKFQRGGWLAWFLPVLLLTSCLLFPTACQTSGPRITDSDPACPQWNDDEWFSYFETVKMAVLIEEFKDAGEGFLLPSIMPSVLATGALLKHCFPEEFTDSQGQLEKYRESQKPGNNSGRYMTFDGPSGQISRVQI